MLNSKSKAVERTLGFKPKEVVSIQVNDASAPPPPQPVLGAAITNMGTKDATTPVIGGEQQIEASVRLQISY